MRVVSPGSVNSMCDRGSVKSTCNGGKGTCNRGSDSE